MNTLTESHKALDSTLPDSRTLCPGHHDPPLGRPTVRLKAEEVDPGVDRSSGIIATIPGQRIESARWDTVAERPDAASLDVADGGPCSTMVTQIQEPTYGT